jgi:hypothetical protein
MHDLLVMFATVVASVATGFAIGMTVQHKRAYWSGYAQAVDDVELVHGLTIRDGDDDGESS